MTNPDLIQNRLARVLDRAIFVSLLAMIALTAVPYGTVEPWWEALFECAVFALAGLWLFEGWLSGGWHVSRRALLAPLIAMLLYMFVQTLTLPFGNEAGAGVLTGGKLWQAISADPYETRRGALKLLALVLAFMLLARYTSNARRTVLLAYTVIGTGVASAIFGIVRQTTQHSDGFILPYLELDSGYGQFINKNHFAFLMEMTLGLILGFVVSSGERRERLLIYMAASIPVWTALVLSNSRGGLLAMMCQLIFAALVWTTTSKKARQEEWKMGSHSVSPLKRLMTSALARAALVVCLIAAAVVGIVWVGGETVVDRFEATSSDFSAQAEATAVDARDNVRRADIWRATWGVIKANPVAGVGIGGYWTAVSSYHDASGRATPQQAHNDYLELLASGGIIGAALAVWFVFTFIRLLRQTLHAGDPLRRALCFGALIGLFGVALHSFLDFGLHITANALIFACLIVLATNTAQESETKLSLKKGRYEYLCKKGLTTNGL